MKTHKSIKIGGLDYICIPKEEYIKTYGLKENLAEKLLRFRLENNLTLSELSNRTGLTIAQLSRLESGQNPQAKTLRKIQDSIGI